MFCCMVLLWPAAVTVEEKEGWRDPKKTARRRGELRPPAATLASVASGAFYQSIHRLFNNLNQLSITLFLCLTANYINL